jgi:hypothetical protein
MVEYIYIYIYSGHLGFLHCSRAFGNFWELWVKKWNQNFVEIMLSLWVKKWKQSECNVFFFQQNYFVVFSTHTHTKQEIGVFQKFLFKCKFN